MGKYCLIPTLGEFLEQEVDDLTDLAVLDTIFEDVPSELFTDTLKINSDLYEAFVAWWESVITDSDYLLTKSINKRVSTQIMYLRKKWTTPASTNQLIYKTVIIQAIERYGFNWIKLFEAYNLTAYKPLENYNMEEVRKPDLTEEIDYTENVDGTRKINTDITTENDSESATGIFGFNSGETSNPTADGTGNTTVHTVGDEDDNTETTNNEKTNTGTKSNYGKEELTRHGNIGVTTSQQMLQSEIELRSYDLQQRIYADLDKYLTLPIY